MLVLLPDIWEHMHCTYERNTALDSYLLASVDDIVDVLEDNNNTLQTMLSNRFVEYFSEKVMPLTASMVHLCVDCFG